MQLLRQDEMWILLVMSFLTAHKSSIFVTFFRKKYQKTYLVLLPLSNIIAAVVSNLHVTLPQIYNVCISNAYMCCNRYIYFWHMVINTNRCIHAGQKIRLPLSSIAGKLILKARKLEKVPHYTIYFTDKGIKRGKMDPDFVSEVSKKYLQVYWPW